MSSMKTVVWSLCVSALGGGLAAGFVSFLMPIDPGVVLDVYLLFLGAVALLALVRTMHVVQPASGRSPFEIALSPQKPRPQRPPELVQLEQHLALAVTTAFDVHFRLRPVVRDIAAQRLWARHAVDLETNPEQAQALLGGEVWELAQPDRSPPPDPFAPGLGQRGVEAVVTELEKI